MQELSKINNNISIKNSIVVGIPGTGYQSVLIKNINTGNSNIGTTLGVSSSSGSSYTPPTTWQNVAWVDQIRGNDSTALLGRPDIPYRTISGASSSALTAGGNWLVHIRAGTYTDTGLLPGNATTNIAYHYDPGTRHVVTGNNHVFNWNGDYSNRQLYITGRCRFSSSGVATTGVLIESDYNTTIMDQFHIECDDMLNANGRGVSLFRLRGTLNSNGSTLYSHNSIDDGSGLPFQFRIDSKFIYINARFIRGIDSDGTAAININCGYLERARLGYPVGFSPAAMTIHADYRVKATSDSAIKMRSGNLIITAPKLEITDGLGSILLIPSDANIANGCNVLINGGFMRSWSGGAGTDPLIKFQATGDSIRVRLNNVTMITEHTGTNPIDTIGPQTIEAYGSLLSNRAIGTGITVRGVTPIINSGFWSGIGI